MQCSDSNIIRIHTHSLSHPTSKYLLVIYDTFVENKLKLSASFLQSFSILNETSNVSYNGFIN